MRGLVCTVVGHRRDAARARSDGYNYRAPCRRCGAPMIKDILGGWRLIDPAHDAEVTPESVAREAPRRVDRRKRWDSNPR